MAAMDAEDREFMRELLRRHEKATDAMVRRLDEGTVALRQHASQMEADHREFIEELRAQRAAAFRILDRLDEGPAGAGA
jgi:hypothetical protein